ncbi:MAG: phosphohydrolase, partial [Candidatus Edwardsbacteria bacterium]|nr:phosphohydrolase [Candidatus Edwardsbacteria bacterium]
LANNGQGLNLTYGVRDGIVCHCGEKYEREIAPRREPVALETIRTLGIYPCSYEGCIVRVSDKVSYLGRDIEDAYRAGLIAEDQIPEKVKQSLGRKNGEIIDTLVSDIIAETQNTGRISFSSENIDLMRQLYDFNMSNIYQSRPLVEYGEFCEKILRSLFAELGDLYAKYGTDYDCYDGDPVPLFRRFGRHIQKLAHIYEAEKTPVPVMVGDYIAGMSDDYALKCMHEVFIPEPLKFDLPRGQALD